MFAVLSPAKKLDLSPPSLDLLPAEAPWTTPALDAEAAEIKRILATQSPTDLRRLMGISAALADLNYRRHTQLSSPMTPLNAKQAALSFNGDVAWGLDPKTIPADTWRWAQQHLGILSGLFGLLRPLDLIQPYRLEMGTRLRNSRGANLYAYWRGPISARLNALTSDHDDRTIINLASSEYAKAMDTKILDGALITIGFKELRPDGPKTIGVVAKRSRGRFARWLVDARIDRREGLKDFNLDDYRFDPALSDSGVWTFSRVEVPGRMKAEFQARKRRDAKLFAPDVVVGR